MRGISLSVAAALLCVLAGCQREYVSSTDPRFPRHDFSPGFVDPEGNHSKLESLKNMTFGQEKPAWGPSEQPK